MEQIAIGRNEKEIEREIVRERKTLREKDIKRDNTVYQELL